VAVPAGDGLRGGGDGADGCADERAGRGDGDKRGLHLMNLTHAAYSFGYAGGAMLTGVLRGAGWGPGWVMGTMAALGVACAALTLERDGRIEGLRKPKDGSGAAWAGCR
jgi:hypothetical protein